MRIEGGGYCQSLRRKEQDVEVPLEVQEGSRTRRGTGLRSGKSGKEVQEGSREVWEGDRLWAGTAKIAARQNVSLIIIPSRLAGKEETHWQITNIRATENAIYVPSAPSAQSAFFETPVILRDPAYIAPTALIGYCRDHRSAKFHHLMLSLVRRPLC